MSSNAIPSYPTSATLPIGAGTPAVGAGTAPVNQAPSTAPLGTAPVYQADQAQGLISAQIQELVNLRNQTVQALQAGNAQQALSLATNGADMSRALLATVSDPTLQAQIQQAGAGFQAIAQQLQGGAPAGGATPGTAAAPAASAQDQKLVDLQNQVVAAIKAGNVQQAQSLATQGQDLAKSLAGQATDPAAKQQYQQVQSAFGQILGQINQATAAAKPKPQHHGIFGFLGSIAHDVGSVVKGALHVVLSPLEAVGKILDPIRNTVMKAFGGLCNKIDGTLGKIPILGSVVRFGTGIAQGAVGLVNGALTAVTHPVETITGLANMAWNLSGMIPFGPKMLWDMGVNGESPLQSMKDGLGAGTQLLTGFFGGAIQDAMQGNYAGALGQATADIGSFFVGAGALKGASVAGDVGRGAAIAEAGASVGRIGGMLQKVSNFGKLAHGGAEGAEVAGDFGRTAKAAALVMRPGIRAGEFAGNLGLKSMSAAWGLNRWGLGKMAGLAERVPGLGRVAKAVDNSRFVSPLMARDGSLWQNMGFGSNALVDSTVPSTLDATAEAAAPAGRVGRVVQRAEAFGQANAPRAAIIGVNAEAQNEQLAQLIQQAEQQQGGFNPNAPTP